MIKQAEKDQWNRFYDMEPLCQLPFSVDEFAQKFGFAFEEYLEDGLGTVFCAFADLDGEMVMLKGYGSRGSKEIGILVEMQGNNPDPARTLSCLLASVGSNAAELAWVRDDMGPPRWALLRQGEDGNEVEIARFHREGIANYLMEEFAKRGHKQVYYVKNMS